MKKIIFVWCLMSMCTSVLYATCTQVSCQMPIMTYKMQALSTIEAIYNELISKLNSELVLAYGEYQKAIEKQNELLKKVQTLKERNTLLEKQILFLRKQDKEIVGLSIDSVGVKKGVEKP